jgi:hypothetical protein
MFIIIRCHKCKIPLCEDCFKQFHGCGAMRMHTCVDLTAVSDDMKQRIVEYLCCTAEQLRLLAYVFLSLFS